MYRRLVSTLQLSRIAASARACQAGATGVFPTGDGAIVPGGTVGSDVAWSPFVSLSCLAADTIGVGMPGSGPFTHEISGKGAFVGTGSIAGATQLPPTPTLQYNPDNGFSLHPCVGLGLNNASFQDVDETAGPDGIRGEAGVPGVDCALQNSGSLGAQVLFMDIDADATIIGGSAVVDGTREAVVNPWVFMASVGKSSDSGMA